MGRLSSTISTPWVIFNAKGEQVTGTKEVEVEAVVMVEEVEVAVIKRKLVLIGKE